MKKMVLSILILISFCYAQTGNENNDFSYALKLYDQKFYDLAAGQFAKFYRSYPDNSKAPEARFLAGMSNYHIKEYDKARIEFQALAIQFPKDKQAAEGWYKAGECSRLTNSRHEAVKSFETVRLLYPQSPFAAKGLYEAGQIYLEDNEYSEAYRDFSIVLDRFRNSPVYFASQVSAGHCLLKQNDIEKAKMYAGLVLGSQAESMVKADALLLMALINETQGYNLDAKKNYDKIIQEHSKTKYFSRAVLNISRLHMQNAEYDQARKYLNTGIGGTKDKSTRTLFHILLGDVNFLQGKFALAQKEYETLSESLSDSTGFVLKLKLALSLRKQGFNDKALIVLKKILDEYPIRQSKIYYEINTVYLNWLVNAGKDEELLQLLDARGSDDTGSVLILARTLAKMERWRDLVHLLQPYNLSKDRFTEKDDFFYYLALASEKLANYEEGAFYYQKIIDEYASSEYYIEAEARLEYLNNFQIAGKDITAAVGRLAAIISRQLNSEKAGVLKYNLGQIYFEELKNYKQAESEFKQALEDSSLSINGDIYLYLGKTYLKLAESGSNPEKFISSAKDYLKQAADSKNNCSQPDLAAWLLLRTIMDQDSISAGKEKQLLEALIEKYPASELLEKWYAVVAASTAYDSAYLSDSVKYFKLLIQNYKDSEKYPTYLFSYAKLIQEDDAEGALSFFKEAALNYPYAHEAASSLYETAEYYENTGLFKEANTLYGMLLEKYYYSSIAQHVSMKQGLLSAKAGDYRTALPVLKKQLSTPLLEDAVLSAELLSNDLLEQLYYLAEAHRAAGNISEAVETYRQYLAMTKSDDLNDQARFNLAVIYFENDRKKTALDNFLAVSNKNPEILFSARKYAAEILFSTGDYKKAGPLFLQLSESADDVKEQKEFQAKRIVALIRGGRIKEGQQAVNVYKKKYKNDKDNFAQFSIEIGNYHRLNKNFDKAVRLFKQIRTKYASTSFADDADYYLAVTYVILNKVEEAFAILTKFYSNHTNSNRLSAALNTLGNLYFRTEKYDNAISMFKNALQSEKNGELKANILSNLIKTYTMTGFWDAAQTSAREYVSEFPYADDVLEKEIIIARAYINLNQFQNSVEHLRKIKLQADSEREPEIQYYIGEALLKAGQYENAIAEFVKIPLLSKKTKLQWEASALYYSGQSYEKLGRIQDAVRMYQEIIRRPGIDLVLKKDAEKRIKLIQ